MRSILRTHCRYSGYFEFVLSLTSEKVNGLDFDLKSSIELEAEGLTWNKDSKAYLRLVSIKYQILYHPLIKAALTQSTQEYSLP